MDERVCLGLVGWESTPPSLSKKNGGEVDVSKKKKDLEKKHPLEIGQNRQREVVVVLAV